MMSQVWHPVFVFTATIGIDIVVFISWFADVSDISISTTSSSVSSSSSEGRVRLRVVGAEVPLCQ